MRRLARRAHTRSELAAELARRNVPVAAAREVLDRMEELRLVDDGAFAVDWVASRQGRRHLSTAALRRELRTKGVAAELVDLALRQVDAADECAAAEELVARRLPAMAGLAPHVRYRRLAGMLERRGFSSGLVSRVLRGVEDVSNEAGTGASD